MIPTENLEVPEANPMVSVQVVKILYLLMLILYSYSTTTSVSERTNMFSMVTNVQ